jgi:Ca-activated chloride channel family protein
MRMGLLAALSGVLLTSPQGCGSGAPAGSSSTQGTLATLTPIRGQVRIDDEAVGALGRVLGGATVTVAARSEGSDGGLARLVLDQGATFLLDQAATLVGVDPSMVELQSGRVLAEVGAGDPVVIETARGTLRWTDGAASVTAEGGRVEVYVVRGEVSYALPANADGTTAPRGVARAGEMLVLAEGAAPAVRAETLFQDWTGGLLSTGPSSESFAPGMGVLEARVPDEVGLSRWPLSIRRLDVRVEIVGELAITEVEEEFFNPASETVEGLYRLRVPEGAVLQRFAVDRNGQMVDGFVREQAQARAAYEAQVYRGSTDDPALLEWDSPGSYRARIYPIAPGEVRRITVRYAEWLRPTHDGGRRVYRYPMGGGSRAPHVQELSFQANVGRAEATEVRAGMGAVVEGGQVELRRSDFRPHADLFIELLPRDNSQMAYRAAHRAPTRAPGSRVIVGEADERDYWYMPLHLPEALFRGVAGEGVAPSEGIDLVIVADVSAGTDRAELELGRSVVESIASHLGPHDRVSIVSADLAIRGVIEGADATALGAPTAERIDQLLNGLARLPAGGATDLGGAIAEAASLLDPTRQGAVIYVGDGAPTVGELGAEGLVEHLLELPRPVRLYAVGVGREANLDLLSAISHGGGLAMRVEGREGAADATLSILEHVARPILQRVTVELGNGIENVFPRVPVDVAMGDVLDVAGRVRATPPTSLVVRGLRNGQPFEEHLDVRTIATDEDPDLRLRWANERLRQLLLSGARREEIAELGTRYGLITPYTSYYVPSAREMASGMYGALQHVPLLTPRANEDDTLATAALTIALGPLSLMGCGYAEAPAPVGGPVNEYGIAVPEEQAEPAVALAVAPMEPEPEMAREAAPSPPPAPSAAPTTTVAPTAPATGADLDDLLSGASVTGSSAPSDSADFEAQVGDEFGAGGLGLRGTGRGGGGSGEGTIGLGNLGTIGHGAGSGSGYGSGGAARPAARARPAPESDARRRTPTRIGNSSPRAQEDRADAAQRTVTERTTITTTITTNVVSHQRSRCSDAARSSLEDRTSLWRERLTQTDYVGSWIETYRDAGQHCEIASGRDRRSFLEALLDRAGSLPRMVEVYRFLPDASARSFFRGAILRRVRTADDLRLVRNAFGLGTGTDWNLVEQVLARATTPAARLRALRQLVQQTPGSFELQLRLLEELEAQQHVPEAVRLAERLRTDPLADPGVRTAIGELYLRLGREDDARRTFSEIVEFQPMDELARRRLGDLYRAHGWYEDAYRQYETLVSIRPDDPTALLLLAQAAAGAGRVDEALRLEQRVMETSAQGAQDGLARVAALWSSVRFAELRKNARTNGSEEQLQALGMRMRRSGVLRTAGAMRVSLVWSHPDANVGLWAAHPGLSLTRPDDLYSELGIEAFDVAEQETLPYRIEVRRNVRDRLGTIEGRLVVVWNEGQADEQIEIIPLTFDAEHRAMAWTISGRALSEAAPSEDGLRVDDDGPSLRTNGGGR